MQGKRNKTGADAVAEVTPRRPASKRRRVEPSSRELRDVPEAQSLKPEKFAVAVSRSGYPDIPTGTTTA